MSRQTFSLTFRPAVAVAVVLMLLGALAAGFWLERRNAPEAGPVVESLASPPATVATPRPGPPTPDLALPAPSFAGEPATVALDFEPALPAGEPREGGSCERESSLAPRADAYTCDDGSQRYDPCYRVAGEEQLFICNARPGAEAQAFLLRSVLPPGENRIQARPEEPWIVELADTSCEKLLGVHLVFGGRAMRYGCRDGSYLLEVPQDSGPGSAWPAQRITLRIEAGSEPEPATVTWSPVRRAWW